MRVNPLNYENSTRLKVECYFHVYKEKEKVKVNSCRIGNIMGLDRSRDNTMETLINRVNPTV